MRVRPSRLLIGLLIVVAAIAIALAVAQDQVTLQLRSGVPATDAASPAYLAALTGSPVSTGNRFTILNNGDEMFPAMLDAVDRAQKRVRFETFVFEDGELATRFVEAFERAARRGVVVDIVVDFIGASDMAEQHLERLRAAGCRVISYNEAEWYHLEEVNYRTHRKILVIDGQVAFTGGAGLADHWLGDAQGPEHWRDIQVGIEGPAARLLEAAFYENFSEIGAPVTPTIDPAPSGGRPVDAAGPTGSTLVVRSSASGGSSDMKRLYLLLIASARRTLDIASPYFVSDESSEWALSDAVARGVRVRILTEGDQTDAMPVKYASRRTYDRLLGRGIQIAEYQPTMFHAKVMVVDGVWSMFGSANFDNRSLELNDELNVVVHEADLAVQFGRIFEEDLRRALALTLPAWRDRPMREKALEFFWGYWGEIF